MAVNAGAFRQANAWSRQPILLDCYSDQHILVDLLSTMPQSSVIKGETTVGMKELVTRAHALVAPNDLTR